MPQTKLPDPAVDSIFDDLYVNVGDTTIDLSSIGGGGSMYDTYSLNNLNDTITLSGIDDWTTSVNNDLNVSGDIKVDGVSLKNWMENVNKRLTILEPKPELLEKYAALQKAYEHYKTLEALLHNADQDTPSPS